MATKVSADITPRMTRVIPATRGLIGPRCRNEATKGARPTVMSTASTAEPAKKTQQVRIRSARPSWSSLARKRATRRTAAVPTPTSSRPR